MSDSFERGTVMFDRLRIFLLLSMVGILSGCASFQLGSNISPSPTYSLKHPEQTRLGKRFEQATQNHFGESGFRIIQAGIDGFLMRMQMIAAAERSLDLQYFIFHGDKTGKLQIYGVPFQCIQVRLSDAQQITGRG